MLNLGTGSQSQRSIFLACVVGTWHSFQCLRWVQGRWFQFCLAHSLSTKLSWWKLVLFHFVRLILNTVCPRFFCSTASFILLLKTSLISIRTLSNSLRIKENLQINGILGRWRFTKSRDVCCLSHAYSNVNHQSIPLTWLPLVLFESCSFKPSSDARWDSLNQHSSVEPSPLFHRKKWMKKSADFSISSKEFGRPTRRLTTKT